VPHFSEGRGSHIPKAEKGVHPVDQGSPPIPKGNKRRKLASRQGSLAASSAAVATKFVKTRDSPGCIGTNETAPMKKNFGTEFKKYQNDEFAPHNQSSH